MMQIHSHIYNICNIRKNRMNILTLLYKEGRSASSNGKYPAIKT